MFWVQLQMITAFFRESISIQREDKLVWGEVRHGISDKYFLFILGKVPIHFECSLEAFPF